MAAFVSSPRFVEHITGPHHPERPDRIRAVHKAVRDAGLIDSPNPFPEFALDLGLKRQDHIRCLEVEPIIADENLLELAHTSEHIHRVKHICELGGGVLDLGDTPVGPTSYEISLLSLGSAIVACDAVMDGRAKRAFSAARPPGHHAEPDRAMGFCLFSNIAIAAKYLQKRHGVGRVAIVDFDVHHGNGTQACLESDPSVLFISLHQDPRTCYPGSGHAYEIGTETGEGFTINLPLQPGSDDDDYLRVIDERVVPALNEFRPEVLLISAGFDAHAEDPLAQMNLSEDGFEQITRRLVAVADQHCGGRVVSMLEGGYNLRALGRSVVKHLTALSGRTLRAMGFRPLLWRLERHVYGRDARVTEDL
ncbi:MAG: histone deacetylase [Anaerolineae bacterium]|nr:histone deacetylase [Phycisphaerae bacterium]